MRRELESPGLVRCFACSNAGPCRFILLTNVSYLTVLHPAGSGKHFSLINLSQHGDDAELYSVLERYAIQLHNARVGLPPTAQGYLVTLNYIDTDGDEIMIDSSIALLNGLEMYQDQGLIKIMANVERLVEPVQGAAGDGQATAPAPVPAAQPAPQQAPLAPRARARAVSNVTEDGEEEEDATIDDSTGPRRSKRTCVVNPKRPIYRGPAMVIKNNVLQECDKCLKHPQDGTGRCGEHNWP